MAIKEKIYRLLTIAHTFIMSTGAAMIHTSPTSSHRPFSWVVLCKRVKQVSTWVYASRVRLCVIYKLAGCIEQLMQIDCVFTLHSIVFFFSFFYSFNMKLESKRWNARKTIRLESDMFVYAYGMGWSPCVCVCVIKTMEKLLVDAIDSPINKRKYLRIIWVPKVDWQLDTPLKNQC